MLVRTCPETPRYQQQKSRGKILASTTPTTCHSRLSKYGAIFSPSSFGGISPGNNIHEAVCVAGKVFRLDSDLCADVPEFGHEYLLLDDAGDYVVVVGLGDLGAVEGSGDEFFVRAEVVDEDLAVDLGGVLDGAALPEEFGLFGFAFD